MTSILSDWPPQAIAGATVIGGVVAALLCGKLAAKLADALLRMRTMALLAAVAGLVVIVTIAAMRG